MRRREKRGAHLAARYLLVEPLESRALLHAGGMMSGSVYFDADGDGTRDAGELGIPGIVIRLIESDSTSSSTNRSTMTDDNGLYVFEEVEPGTYEVSKRQTPATLDSSHSAALSGSASNANLLADVVLADDEILGGNNFAEQGLRAEYLSYRWFTTIRPVPVQLLRETIAQAEERAGDASLAASIRAGTNDVSEEVNSAPVAADDVFLVEQDDVLTIPAINGVLANDVDPDGDSITATLIGQASNGFGSIGTDGSLTYTPDAGFSGVDTLTYQVSDGITTSNLATVTINVNQANQRPVAVDDEYTVVEGGVLTVGDRHGVLLNDTDPDGDVLTADLVSQATNGSVELSGDGSFTYTPADGFTGEDSFTYTAADGGASSQPATVRITVSPAGNGNELFGPVTPGSFENPALLGIRTDLVTGAPAISAAHVDGDIDYTGYSNPPTYGPHHGFDPSGTDVNPGITPRPTGIYTTEQPEEDLIHNLEHGHVWISYGPNLISAEDRAALEQLVRDGSPNSNGSGVGVVLTPREANDTMIALASWARLLTLDNYDPATIRDFVETNRGQAPEGFITP